MPPAPVLAAAARKAAAAAFVSLVLFTPFVGMRLEDVDGHNGLAFRPGRIAIAVVLVFFGRLAMDLWGSTLRNLVARVPPLPKLPPLLVRIALALVLAVALIFPQTRIATRYDLDILSTFLTYVMLGWGLNIVVGLAGLLDLGYVAFYAAGAYTFALLASNFGFGFWLALPISGLVAATLGMLLGFPVLRLKGDYLAIVTLGFGEIIRIILINWSNVTGGPNGISGIPRPTFFGAPFMARARNGGTTFAQFFHIPFAPQQRVAWLYYVILGLALVTLAFTQRLRRLPIGRAWEALREDEIACQAVGLNPTVIKLTAFSLGAMLGGIAGCFFAARQGFVSPESFTFSESAVILAIVVLGGMGSQFGVVIAAAVLVGLPELGRSFAEYRMLFFGLAMVLIMVWRPRGLIAGRTPSIRVDPKRFEDVANDPTPIGAVH